MIKKTLIIMLIIIISLTFAGKYIIENNINEQIHTNKKISIFFEKDSYLKCNVLPFECSIYKLKFNIDNSPYQITMDEISMDGISIFNIVKFINNEKEDFFTNTNKYNFVGKVKNLKINNSDLSIFNIKNINKVDLLISEKLKSLGNKEAEDKLEILITSNNQELFLIKTETKIKVKENNLFIPELKKLIIISDRNKDISKVYYNTMYSKYLSLNKNAIFSKNKLNKQEAFKHIKDNTLEQVKLVKKYLNKMNLDINDTTIEKINKILIGENNEEFEIEITKK